jgi:hypothetical protein
VEADKFEDGGVNRQPGSVARGGHHREYPLASHRINVLPWKVLK